MLSCPGVSIVQTYGDYFDEFRVHPELKLKELRQKSLARDPLNEDEKASKDAAAKRRDSLKQKLQRFITRIPAFMYLTDDREKTIRDIITQIEPDLFQRVTGLTLNDFAQLVDAGVFNDAKMNDAVWKFRDFEEPSLGYNQAVTAPLNLGGWSLRRDERFSRLIDGNLLRPGDVLVGANGAAPVSAIVTDDFGLSVNGIRYESPDEAAEAASDGNTQDGWNYWRVETASGATSLADLV
jgi:Restriction Enzyme Adenine Methylase Associated